MSHVYLLTIVFAIYIIDGIATATSSPSQLTQVSHREVPIAMQCTQHLARHPSKQAFLLRLLCSFWVSIWSTVVEPQVCGTRPVKNPSRCATWKAAHPHSDLPGVSLKASGFRLPGVVA